jgi:hypothetical protein
MAPTTEIEEANVSVSPKSRNPSRLLREEPTASSDLSDNALLYVSDCTASRRLPSHKGLYLLPSTGKMVLSLFSKTNGFLVN